MLDKLIDFLLDCLRLGQFWQVVDVYEKGVVLRLGIFQRELEPGFHWVIPFSVDKVLIDNVVWRIVHLGAQTVTTLDGKTVTVTAVVTARIKHIQKALLEVEGIDHALIDACSASVATHVASNNWDALRAVDFSEKLMKECRKEAFTYGIEIKRVQLADMCTSRSIRLHMPAPK